MSTGKLFLIPVPLADDTIDKVIPVYHQQLINTIGHFIVENEKTARKWLKAMNLEQPQSGLKINVYGKHADKSDINLFLKPLLDGFDVGLMSEAGCPAIADPGAEIVALAHQKNIEVVPLSGPNSILMALMASGFNGQSFTFHGYLPIDKADRGRKIKDMEMLAVKFSQTQLFMETPFRNNHLLDDILKTCSPQNRLCIAANLTAADEFIATKTIAQWRKEKIDLHKKPVIFVLYKS